MTSAPLSSPPAQASGGARAKARRAWGGNPPDWVAELAAACDATSQNRVAKRIGYSATTISQVLSRTYRGDMARVEQAVRGALMHETVLCPVLGELPQHVCLEHQKKAARGLIGTSSWRTRLTRTCPTCEHATSARND